LRCAPAPARAPYLARHWRGELHLLVALVASGALVWLTVQALELVAHRLPMTEHPLLGATLWVTEVAVVSCLPKFSWMRTLVWWK
jgi:hypothetical protein